MYIYRVVRICFNIHRLYQWILHTMMDRIRIIKILYYYIRVYHAILYLNHERLVPSCNLHKWMPLSHIVLPLGYAVKRSSVEQITFIRTKANRIEWPRTGETVAVHGQRVGRRDDDVEENRQCIVIHESIRFWVERNRYCSVVMNSESLQIIAQKAFCLVSVLHCSLQIGLTLIGSLIEFLWAICMCSCTACSCSASHSGIHI